MTTPIQERVDKEINACTLKNSLPSVFRLSPETLEEIFILVVHRYHESGIDTTFRVPCWVNVSYVCQYWRDVALNCPVLWSYHFTVSLRWTEELLARSKQASLKIRIYHDHCKKKSWWLCLLENVLNHAERIQELRLEIPDYILLPETSFDAPRLQILDISTCDGPLKAFTINNGDALPLRILKLSICCPFPWHSFNLSGVTLLHLQCIPAPSQQNITELLATLSRMQALQFLYLWDAILSARDFISHGTISGYPKVDLPSLFCVSISAPLSTIVALLSCTITPSETRLWLEVKDEEGDNYSVDDYSRLPSVLAQRFTQSEHLSSSCPTIRSLAIKSDTHASTIALGTLKHCYCDPSLLSLYPPQDYSTLLMVQVDMMKSSERNRVMSDICCSIPLAQVRTLNITNPPSSPHFWEKILGHLDGLRSMALKDGIVPDLTFLALPPDGSVESLREGFTGDHDPTQRHIFIPALEELFLENITFGLENDLSGFAISEKALCDALSTRKAPCPLVDMWACNSMAKEQYEMRIRRPLIFPRVRIPDC